MNDENFWTFIFRLNLLVKFFNIELLINCYILNIRSLINKFDVCTVQYELPCERDGLQFSHLTVFL